MVVPINVLPPNQVEVVDAFPIQVLLLSVAETPTLWYPIKILFDPVVFAFAPDAPACFPIPIL